MILSVSDAPTNAAKQLQQQQQHQHQHQLYSSSLSLRTLVDIASTLFDQTTLQERGQAMARETQERQEHKVDSQGDAPRQQQQRQPLMTKPQNKETFSAVSASTSASASVTNHELATKTTRHRTIGISNNSSSSRNSSSSPNKNNFIFQPTTFQCCTREGFLSRLSSVLNDPSLSNVLTWMPDGGAFTIVSPREFSKTGMVYELFGIRKMSSFLRRLNQLGFARVRDPTDPKNLDVFRKHGFVAVGSKSSVPTATNAATNAAAATTKTIQRLGSPTSTLLYAPAIATKTDNSIPRNSRALPSLRLQSLSIAPRISSPASSASSVTASTSTISSSDSTESTWSTAPSSSLCACSTPETVELSRPQVLDMNHIRSIPPAVAEANHGTHSSLPLVSMPPSMPASSSGGPVLLRARGESYDVSATPLPPPPAMAKAMAVPLPLTKPTLQNARWEVTKTPRTNNTKTNNNRRQLELSPGSLRTLELPNLELAARSHSSASAVATTTATIRPPPLHFVAECVRQLLVQESEPSMPMELEREVERNDDRDEKDATMSRDTPPYPRFPRMFHLQTFPKMQHQREYLSLYHAAECEADAILNTSNTGSMSMRWEGEGHPSPAGSKSKSNEAEQEALALSYAQAQAQVFANVQFLRGTQPWSYHEVSIE